MSMSNRPDMQCTHRRRWASAAWFASIIGMSCAHADSGQVTDRVTTFPRGQTTPAPRQGPTVLPPKQPGPWMPIKRAGPEHEVRLKRVDATHSIMDASGSRLLYTLPLRPRTFASVRAVLEALRARFGGTLQTGPDDRGRIAGRLTMIGSGYWVAPGAGPRRIYQVTDPVLAWLGGASGTIRVAGRTLCIDPDGACKRTPSYLALVARPTHGSSAQACSDTEGRNCVAFQSFMNKFNVFDFFKYARHGANTRITSGKAGAVWRLDECPASTTAPTETASRLETVLQTGGDDLRDGSHAWMTVTLVAREGLPPPPVTGALPRISLNAGAGLNNHTRFTAAPYPLPPGTQVGHIATISIEHESVQRNAFDTRDNWNLDSIVVSAVTPSGARTILSRRGPSERREAHRFSGAAPVWALPVAADAGEPLLCWRELPGRHIAVTGGTLFVIAELSTDPDRSTLARVGAFLPVNGVGVESVETAHWFVGIGASVSSSGVAPGVAPEDVVYEAVGVCAGHSADGISAASGHGQHDDASCPSG